MGIPSESLAERVMDRLIEEKLLTPEDRKKLLTKLGEGKLKQEDWRLAIELAQDKVKKA
jgi:hypothetical protein